MKPSTQQFPPQENNFNESTQTNKTAIRNRDLDNLNRNLMKKVYTDLFTRNVQLYQEKDLTFENFVFHFYTDFENLIDFENPDYYLLLERMDTVVKARFNRENNLSLDKNKLQLMHELNLLSQDDEWALIDKYQKALYLEEKERKKKLDEEKRLKYFIELDQQVKDKKNYIDPILKKKEEIYLFKEKENLKNLELIKINNYEKINKLKQNIINNKCILPQYLNYLEKENFGINDNNKDLISYKIDKLIQVNDVKYLNDDTFPSLIKQIICEKDLDKIKKCIKQLEYKKELIDQRDYTIKHIERPSKMTVEERKMNKDLLEAAKNYFKQKYKLVV